MIEWWLMKESYINEKWSDGLLNKWTIDVLKQLFMVDVHIQGFYPHMV